MLRLTDALEIEDARRQLSELLDARGAWFCLAREDGAANELRRGEWELSVSSGALRFSFWGDAGARTWRIAGWEKCGEKLRLDSTRRMGAERATLELVPCASVSAAKALIASARTDVCKQLAMLASAHLGSARIESAKLSRGARRGEPGRYTRITLKLPRGRIAVAAPAVDLGREESDAFLTSSLLWFERLCERARQTSSIPQKLFLLAPRKLCEATCERVALLRGELRRAIEIYEVGDEQQILMRTHAPELRELLAAAPRFFHPVERRPSALAVRIVALAPEAIDVVRARRGETLRFHGLPFARVRRLMNREQAWFGIEGASKRRLIDEENWPELLKLVAELTAHRRADACDRRHIMYRAQPEAWLESILRRDITRLDPGLILSPLHSQFRPSSERSAGTRPLDLLALRRDGRLVVIELKVAEDAALALQGADYWRRVETHRRHGRMTDARFFGDAEIANEPPLVYLVAPLLRFHRSFHTLARAIRPEIEIYRFDLNEDWRTGAHVTYRCDLA